jgi:hypothetical protein
LCCAEECDEIIRLAEPRLQASTVIDKKSFEVNSTVLSKSGLRTSSGMFLDRAETKTVSGVFAGGAQGVAGWVNKGGGRWWADVFVVEWVGG